MKKIFLFLHMIMLIYNISFAQVIMNVQLPQMGLNIKSQLWNITLTNSASTFLTLKINMVMTDIASGQQVMSASTNFFQLQQGSKIIQYNDVVPVSYAVLNDNYAVDATPNGFLPIGNFNVCYEILKLENENFESMTEDCATIEVEPASPPYLSMPNDESEIEEQRPLFTWIPPAPVNLFNNLSYTLNVVEVFRTQNSSSAIQQNFPILSQQYITGLSFQYPFSSNMLDTGKTYAWQVTANNNSLLVAKSDIWTFRVKSQTKDIFHPKETSYFKLTQLQSSGYFICEGILKFEYNNEINDSNISFRIYDITRQHKKLITPSDEILKTIYGQNLVDIDLIDNKYFISGHLYSIEVTNSKEETWSGKFEYKKLN